MRVTPQLDTINSFPIANNPEAQSFPATVFNGENHIVVWGERRFTGIYFWTTVGRVTPAGAVLDTGNCIGSGDEHSEFYPDIAFDGNRCFVVWYRSIFTPYGIYGRFVNSSAMPEDTVLMVGDINRCLYNYPKVDYGTAAYLVVWADERQGDTDYDILGQLVSPAGELIGGTITIATGPEHQERPDVAFDGYSFLAIWTSDSCCIYGQRIAQNGQFIGPSFLISEATSYHRRTPRICAGTNNFLVAWSELRGTYDDIYGNTDVLVGIANDEKQDADHGKPVPTIFSGNIALPKDVDCRIIDISGRIIEPGTMRPGIYFVEINGHVKQKIVMIQ